MGELVRCPSCGRRLSERYGDAQPPLKGREVVGPSRCADPIHDKADAAPALFEALASLKAIISRGIRKGEAGGITSALVRADAVLDAVRNGDVPPLTDQIVQITRERDVAQLRAKYAEQLADAVDVLVRRRVIDSRSPAADALLDFREVPQSPRSDRLVALESSAEFASAMLDEITGFCDDEAVLALVRSASTRLKEVRAVPCDHELLLRFVLRSDCTLSYDPCGKFWSADCSRWPFKGEIRLTIGPDALPLISRTEDREEIREAGLSRNPENL